MRIRTDGASRGNPGPAAIGVVVEGQDGSVLAEVSLCIGRTTNNVAEYRALIAGLDRALELGATAVTVVTDSELMMRQVRGIYAVKSPALAPLLQQVRGLQRRFQDGFTIEHTPRGGNARADALANRALDAAARGGNTAARSGGLTP